MRSAFTAGTLLLMAILPCAAVSAASARGPAGRQVLRRSTPAILHQTAELSGGGAAGAGLGSSVAVDGKTIVVGAPAESSSLGAAYVFVDSGGTWIQQARLIAPDGAAGDSFGASVSIAGSTIVVGAPGHNASVGAAYVYARSGVSWKRTAELIGTATAANDTFGSSVSISGTTAAVGAPGHGGTGAAYMFHESGGKWSQSRVLSPATGKQFGYSVAISGPNFIAGSIGTSGTGGAYVFKQAGNAWNQVGKVLTPADGSYGNRFGEAVALSGTTAVVGSALHSYVFGGSTGTWTQQAELTASGASEFWGVSVGVSGSTIVIGSNLGYYPAYVFKKSNGTWSRSATLSGQDTLFNSKYGSSVGVSAGVVVVGDPGQNAGGGPGSGAAYAFTASGGSWTAGAELSSRSSSALVGDSVAISGSSALVGAPGANQYHGAALLFGGSQAWSEDASFTASDGAMADELGLLNIAVSGNVAVVGAPHRNTLTGTAYVFVKTHGVWAQQAELVGSDTAMFDQFGFAVAIAGDTIVVGAPDHGLGAAYVFTRSGTSWTQQKELSLPSASAFGNSVAMSGSSTILVGSGAGADVFTGSGGSWTHRASLAVPGGDAVSISGPTAVVGAGSGDSASVFALANGKWSRQVVLKPAGGSSADKFGASVGISGTRVVVGAPGRSNNAGAAYVFSRNGSRWSETDVLAATDRAANSGFGISVGISGSTAVVGAPEAASYTGAAYVFTIPASKATSGRPVPNRR